MNEKVITVAVAGQPNVGKSTLFNILTGKRVIVANWPGVTVERHEGWREYKGYKLHFIDLPGIYGFSASSLEEVIARNYILGERPDVLLVLVDSTIPERTMYLALEALEIFPKVIIVFTKSDLTHVHGIHINYGIIEKRLGVPVVPVSAASGVGIDELLDKIIDVAHGKGCRKKPLRINYGGLEPFVKEAEKLVSRTSLVEDFPSRWLAVKLLEGDRDLIRRLEKRGYKDIVDKVLLLRREIERIFRSRPEEVFSRIRYDYLLGILRDAIVRVEVKESKYSERIDRLFAHPILGPITSITLLLFVFMIVFILNTGFPLTLLLEAVHQSDLAEAIEAHSLGGLMESLFEWISNAVEPLIKEYPDWFQSLVLDGIIGGIGAVLVFLPLIFLVSLFLAILEDTGFAPRIAMSLHMLFQKIGLSGHAVFPVTLSLGCNVPGIMATRATPNFRERLRLIMITPFIPCQARLVVVLAFASALTGAKGLFLVVLAYFTAFLVFSIISYILYGIEKEEAKPELLLEIPPLHKPLLKVVWWLTWDSTKHFLKKAGTIIFIVTLVSWALIYYTPSLTPATDPSESIGAKIAALFAPLLYPLGFTGEQAWKIAYALIVGFLAKEAIISTLTLLTDANTATTALIKLGLSDAQIVSLTIFSILYVPCLATIAVIYFESRSMKTTLITIALMMVVAYFAAFLAHLISVLI
ncbi:ferrous iron transport protein B [Desulfurococcaceae archaeon MEX13E-LK6-19]|nr:ferrous iron transport protein B [Desulfurococcaceae archaeon MEX13E-LK6-19]